MRHFFVLFILGILMGCSSEKGNLEPVHLRCEYLENPQVVDVEQPRLAWINQVGEELRGESQTAWQVRVASSPGQLEDPDLWDSGKQLSEQSNRVLYQGKKLDSGQDCWWQVRTWDGRGQVSKWSEPGFWRMGLLQPTDWKAAWIGAPWEGDEPAKRPVSPAAIRENFGPPAPMFRKDFLVEGDVEKAVAFVTGLGYFELFLNGSKVGDDVLVPNQTNYGKRPGLMDALIAIPDEFAGYKVMYMAYEISGQLEQGENTLGSILGNGFYNPEKFWTEGYGTPRFLCQLQITYRDGTEQRITSGSDWKAAKSPILDNMVYWGETYDAREEQDGWNRPGFDDSSWEEARIVEGPSGKLVAHTANPDRVMKQLKPLSIEQLGKGHYKVDFGEEISGWVRLAGVDGPSGHRIEIIPNANLYSGENFYICNGEGPANYAPRFNWMVFSGVEIKNWPGELKPEQILAESVHTRVEASARFETSNELFNRINDIWRRSQTDNMHGGIASDCPHRERSGYTGDGQIACMTVLHNYDARNFYQKWIADMRDAQNPEDGYVPNGAPWQPGCGGGPAWGAAICVMPWEYYVQYGSRDMLVDNYDAMKGYVGYMLGWTGEDGIMHSQRTARDGSVLKWFNLGDWVPPGKMVPDEMVHTFYLWYCSQITSLTAGVLGQEAEAAEYARLAEKTKLAFQKRFYNEEDGSYGDAGGNILALHMGVPTEQYDRVVAAVVRDIKSKDGHLDTGIIGTRFYFEVLAENGLNHLAYEAMNKKSEPSFGHWIELGSTTTREQWGEGGSYNHPMFGGGLTWLYRNLAGMKADPGEPGYRHIIFRPQPVDELESASYFNRTSYGEAGIQWRNTEAGFEMHITVPVGCRSTVYVPAADAGLVSEGQDPASSAMGVSFLEMDEGYAVYSVNSGSYHFRVKP